MLGHGVLAEFALAQITRLKWIEREEDAEVWSRVSPQSETWAEVTKQSETWTEA